MTGLELTETTGSLNQRPGLLPCLPPPTPRACSRADAQEHSYLRRSEPAKTCPVSPSRSPTSSPCVGSGSPASLRHVLPAGLQLAPLPAPPPVVPACGERRRLIWDSIHRAPPSSGGPGGATEPPGGKANRGSAASLRPPPSSRGEPGPPPPSCAVCIGATGGGLCSHEINAQRPRVAEELGRQRDSTPTIAGRTMGPAGRKSFSTSQAALPRRGVGIGRLLTPGPRLSPGQGPRRPDLGEQIT
ncbi:WAS/WASL-interacting protein family member 1-like [Balaenoptera musculus]|uniref:WAS/WASL-interacting protein family member 1-like n=1 Tax=Balaenoptera musculus TaxID=9771 RepID=A0A8B8VUZ0_BALMU|nr:WAS/WASL-interacting protein family member 1-like [Balaenoptera musculus]